MKREPEEESTATYERVPQGVADRRQHTRWCVNIVHFLSRYAIVMVLVTIFILGEFAYTSFLSPANILNILNQNVDAGIIAVGMTFVILTGGFDLSVGAVYALSALVFATLSFTTPLWIAVACALFVGAAVGLANGALVSLVGVNPFMTTLGTGTIISGVAVLYSHSQPILSTASDFGFFSTLQLFGVPLSVYMLIMTFIVGFGALHATKWGKDIYAIGGNLSAAELAGIRTGTVCGSSYVAAGALAALSGVVMASILGGAQSNMGGDLALSTIAIVVIGGTSLGGGKGAMWRTGVGFLIIASLRTLFNSLALNSSYIDITQGAILIVAVAIDAISNSDSIVTRLWRTALRRYKLHTMST